MKKIIFYSCFLLLLQLIACNTIVEKDSSAVITPNKNSAKIEFGDIQPKISLSRAILLNYSIPEQRERFRILSADEKAALWQNKIGSVIGLKEWNVTQKKLLVNLYNHISPELYQISSLTVEQNNQLFEQEWVNEAKLNFDKTELALIVAFPIELQYDVNTQKIIPLHKRDSIQLQEVGLYCECNRGSDWCFIGFKCKIPCAFVTSWGCGFMWQYSCNGTCGARPVVPE